MDDHSTEQEQTRDRQAAKTRQGSRRAMSYDTYLIGIVHFLQDIIGFPGRLHNLKNKRQEQHTGLRKIFR